MAATKAESQKIFEKLKTKAANKKNPTWSSVPFGIYLCLDCSSNHRNLGVHISFVRSTNLDIWQWDQLRIMKVGGNESATKYFQTHGGGAALNSKDPKTKYTSAAATKYKEELSKRVIADQQKYPELVITDVVDAPDTPEPSNDDFFSSWDKPTIKRPSNPPSRTGTPLQRAGTPLSSNGNGVREAPKAIPASAVRKPVVTAAKKTNILGAKKPKLGAKKISAADDLDFDEAERKAKEEADRIEKLGYDPNADAPATTPIASPTPVSPGAFATKSPEVDRLGVNVQRLGFGQTALPKASAPKAAPARLGFGAVKQDTDSTARDKFGTQKGISSDEYFGRNQFDPSAQQEAKTRLHGFEGATSISSNAYFGRPEDDAPPEEYGDLETAARDVIRKFGLTAGDDLENLTNLVGEGASRLQGAIRNYLNG